MHSELPSSSVPSATAVRFMPRKVMDSYCLIVGQETGELTAWLLTTAAKWDKVFSMPSYFNHACSVRRIKFNLR